MPGISYAGRSEQAWVVWKHLSRTYDLKLFSEAELNKVHGGNFVGTMFTPSSPVTVGESVFRFTGELTIPERKAVDKSLDVAVGHNRVRVHVVDQISRGLERVSYKDPLSTSWCFIWVI